MRAPASPGSVLLGINESDVERPTTPTAFMFSLRQASNDLSALPKNWAIDLAPGIMLNPNVSAKQAIGLATGASALKPGQRMWQSFILSLATRNLSNEGDTSTDAAPQLAIGFKVSLCQGRPSVATKKQFAELDSAMVAFVDTLHRNEQAIQDADPTYQLYLSQEQLAAAKRREYKEALLLLRARRLLNTDTTARRQLDLDIATAMLDSVRWTLERDAASQSKARRSKELDDQLKERLRNDRDHHDAERDRLLKATEEFSVKRVGFKWDVAGGCALDFVDRKANNSQLTKAGLWTTFGWETEEDVAFLMFARWLANPNGRYIASDTVRIADFADLDLGARVLLEPNGGRFSFSAEAIYRQPQNNLGLQPTWRVVANTSYDLGNNRRLAFSFGKNYDGTITHK
ncbi:MAG TPA: hypothetical protein PK760_13360, partial [Flavobacteriales bacterium]|nr:hypothetical protein [Flavobacteriales bacterium]